MSIIRIRKIEKYDVSLRGRLVRIVKDGIFVGDQGGALRFPADTDCASRGRLEG